MKRFLFLIIALTFSLANSVGQQHSQFSQYMLNLNNISPADVGSSGMINLFGTTRQQWVGLEGAPKSTMVSVDLPFNINNTKHGAGLYFLDESIGLFSNQSVNLEYAYHMLLSEESYLSGGFTVNFKSLSFNSGDVYNVTSDYHTSSDTSIPTGSEVSDLRVGLGIGFLFRTKDLFAGISLLNVTSPVFELGNVEFKDPLNLCFTGGYNIFLPNSLYVLKPSTLLKTDFSSWQIDINANLEYKETFWGGIGYRMEDAVVFMLGMRVFDGLKIGYSFDLPTSKLINTGAGNHEITLGYSFNMDFSKKNSYKSIRFL